MGGYSRVMSWQDWADRAARPIPVEGGLVARSERGAIGSTWWSKRFVAALEALSMGGRLTRGRTYARKGQVLTLDVRPGVV
ncbi:MAG: SWIM zinc finger family protein, partial [Kineosporiaceae bacterium]